jgi:hypothetical protein
MIGDMADATARCGSLIRKHGTPRASFVDAPPYATVHAMAMLEKTGLARRCGLEKVMR